MTTQQQLKPAGELAKKNGVRFPNESDEYRRARDALLAEEIELRRHIERVAEQRRALPPGGAVSKQYRFEGENGPTDFSKLFGDRQTLAIYSYMYGPKRDLPCPMCTSLLSAWDGEAVDVEQRIARGTIGGVLARELKVFQQAASAVGLIMHGVCPLRRECPSRRGTKLQAPLADHVIEKFSTYFGYLSFGYQSGPRPSGVLSRIVQSGIRSGAPRASWPGSAVSDPISPLQKWRMVPSRRVKTLKPGTSASAALT